MRLTKLLGSWNLQLKGRFKEMLFKSETLFLSLIDENQSINLEIKLIKFNYRLFTQPTGSLAEGEKALYRIYSTEAREQSN